MKTVVLGLLLILANALNIEALKCFYCLANDMDECNQEGSIVTCPQDADTCSSIASHDSVMKSCLFKSYCEKLPSLNSEVTVDCCYTDNCNGPHRTQRYDSYEDYGRTHYGVSFSAASCSTISTLLLVTTIIQLAFSVL
ncbi:uncharacterized protein si:ch211-113d22.2 [Engraulis encrasicolus]|uniref:uncharacterized protein si:ch211-113d22.2 n=1 Tax=Engraulis encrasicolus TaxID=184585 RepID=UPI002FD1F5E8